MKTASLLALLMALSFQSSEAAEPEVPEASPTAVPLAPGLPATPPADPAKFELYLLVGQSNMAGRGPLTPADKVADPRVLVLDHADKWVTKGEPIHFDKPGMLGVGPGYTFGKLMADHKPGVIIGLIPCAFGGTTLEQWDPKSTDKKLYPPDNLYENAIRRAQIAMKSGTLKGILWHQGEGNSGSEAAAKDYAARLAQLIASFRTDLNAPKVPFIVGEIGYFLYVKGPLPERVNSEIDKVPQVSPYCAVASAKGLTDKGDHLHFNNASQKELGKRYFEAYLQMQDAPSSAKP